MPEHDDGSARRKTVDATGERTQAEQVADAAEEIEDNDRLDDDGAPPED